MTFVPTLNFNGKCHETMELYKKAFFGKNHSIDDLWQ